MLMSKKMSYIFTCLMLDKFSLSFYLLVLNKIPHLKISKEKLFKCQLDKENRLYWVFYRHIWLWLVLKYTKHALVNILVKEIFLNLKNYSKNSKFTIKLNTIHSLQFANKCSIMIPNNLL